MLSLERRAVEARSTRWNTGEQQGRGEGPSRVVVRPARWVFARCCAASGLGCCARVRVNVAIVVL